MSLFKILSISSFLFFALGHAATFSIVNNCSYTVWAAAMPQGRGRQLDPGRSWTLKVSAGSTGGRIWARTACSFDKSGNGTCQTGDCGGRLQCESYGTPPVTSAEFALNRSNNTDFFDLSLVDGFNVPMAFNPTSEGCSRGIQCTEDIVGSCPPELQAPGGCNNPCTVFKTAKYCCTEGGENCRYTYQSAYFKDMCPDAYSYPYDDATSIFTCPAGTNYSVTFCPLQFQSPNIDEETRQFQCTLELI